MPDGARRDLRAQVDDLVGDRPRVGVDGGQRLLRDGVEVVVIALDELDDDRFLRVEVVVEASRQDAARVGDLLQRRSQARRREEGGRGVEDLRSARPADRHGADATAREPNICSMTPTRWVGRRRPAAKTPQMTAYDLVVIGGGPAGEKAAVQAAYWGKRVAVVERSPAPGGAMVGGAVVEQDDAGGRAVPHRVPTTGHLRGQHRAHSRGRHGAPAPAHRPRRRDDDRERRREPPSPRRGLPPRRGVAGTGSLRGRAARPTAGRRRRSPRR